MLVGIKDEFVKALATTSEIKAQEAQPICLLIGSLHITSLLEPNTIKLIIENFIPSIDHLSIESVAKLYLAISRVYNDDCFQQYEQMKSDVFEKLESSEISIDLVLTLSMPLSMDGLGSESPIWQKFKNCVIDNQN